MPLHRGTFWDEAQDAARGVLALVMGNRQASSYFDFSQRGLIGSFIAFLAVTGLDALLPLVLGTGRATGPVWRSVLVLAVLFAMQVTFSALVLRQLKRLDGLVPYLVASNWTTFYLTLATLVLGVTGMVGDIVLVGVSILVLIIVVNIGRLIVTLSPLQIAMFLVAQLVGVSIGLVLIGGLVVPPGSVPAIAQ